MDWGVLLSNREWQQTLKEMTCKFDTQKVGTTITIWKIYADRFECYWIGDSSGKLYSNNELLFQTRDHDYNNQDELIRIQEGMKRLPARTIVMSLESLRGERK